jgi:phosphoribosylanthranilate isomerase
MTVKLKICGMTRLADIEKAAAIGVYYLGFIFHSKSPRYVTPETAKDLTAQVPAGIKKVGVFVNMSAEEVLNIMEQCGLDIAQLHGDEPEETALKIGRERVWKAVNLQSREDIAYAAAYPAAAILADSRSSSQYGGTGSKCDWSLAAEAAKQVKLVLAGGLTPENVVEAVQQVNPFALDVNSGIESAPGVKDHNKILELAKALKKLT